MKTAFGEKTEVSRQRTRQTIGLRLLSRPGQILLDLSVLAVALVLAYAIRFEFAAPFARTWWHFFVVDFTLVGPEVLIVQMAMFYAWGIYEFIWRYVGLADLKAFAGAFLSSTIILIVVRLSLPPFLGALSVPLSVIAIDSLLAFGFTLALRLTRRVLYERQEGASQKKGIDSLAEGRHPHARRKPVLLVGAGHGGVLAARELAGRGGTAVKVSGFVDDDMAKVGKVIQGVKVLGTTEQLVTLVPALGIDRVIITIADASRAEIRRIVDICERIPVRATIMPELYDILADNFVFPTTGEDLPIEESAAPRIYLSPPHVGPRERELLLDAFESNWIAPIGPHLEKFEEETREYVGAGAAVALSSGTAALHLALQILGVGQEDEVLCSTFTFAATANAIRYRGAVPVFVDSNRETWNMDPQLLEDELRACATRGRVPKAAIVVDLYGQTADFDPILEICDRYGVLVVEDAAEALGATYRGRRAGTFGAMATLSFNGNKIITTSGGGMLLSSDAAKIRRARYLATQARDPAPYYQHSEIGYNYRMSNLLAAVGRGQLESIEDRVTARREVCARYARALAGLPGIALMPEASYGRSNRWLTCITIDPSRFGASAEDVRLALEHEIIEARPVWKPMHLQPVFSSCRCSGGEVSARLFATGLCLPSGSKLTQADQDRVIEIVKRCGGTTARPAYDSGEVVIGRTQGGR